MAHYAFLDDNNVVVDVIVGRDEDDLPHGITSWEEYYGAKRGMRCLRTSVNMLAGKHKEGKTPFRANFAMIGGTYDAENDAFIPAKPDSYPSFVLDGEEFVWGAPIPYPDDGLHYYWDEEQVAWIRNEKGPTEPPPKKGEWIWQEQKQAWLPA